MGKINPLVDFAFKKLFGVEENKDILISLINSIVSEEDHVEDLTLLNPYNEKNFRDDKMSILDIKARNQSGKYYNIEMQILDQDYYNARALYYWSRIYNTQLKAGRNYDLLKKTISINILNFNCIHEEENHHNCYRILNVDSKKELMNHLELHFIELPKASEKLGEVVTILDKWISFLTESPELTSHSTPAKFEDTPTIQKAIQVLDNLSLTTDEREEYEARLKWLRDEQMAIRTATRKGIEQGIKQGIEQGKKEGLKKALKKLTKSGMSEKEARELLGLSKT